MKKILVSLTLVGMVALMSLALLGFAAATSATAVASTSNHTAFTASGNVCLATEPIPISIIPADDGFGLTATLIGESYAGTILHSSDWDELDGSNIGIAIGQEVATFDFITNTFRGDMSGTLSVQTEEELLSGSFEGTVTGMFDDPTDLLGTIFQSTANVEWNITGEEIAAQGNAIAPNFTFDPNVGFCSDIFFDGTFTELDDQDTDDDQDQDDEDDEDDEDDDDVDQDDD